MASSTEIDPASGRSTAVPNTCSIQSARRSSVSGHVTTIPSTSDALGPVGTDGCRRT